jgi:hypothetical protein
MATKQQIDKYRALLDSGISRDEAKKIALSESKDIVDRTVGAVG